MGTVLLFAVLLGLPLAIVLMTRQEKKRGCGRGCATCGNREICYRNGKTGKSESTQNKA